MAVTPLGSATISGNFAGTSALTYSYTVASGSNRLLLVGVEVFSADPTGVTFNGVALTKAATVAQADGTDTSLWYLINPTVTTANIVVTCAGTSYGMSAAQAWQGAHQTTPIGATDAVAGATSTTSLSRTVASAVGNIVAAFVAAFDSGSANSFTWGSATELLDAGDSAGEEQRLSLAYAAGATSVTMTATLGAASDGSCALVVADIAAAAVATVAPLPFRPSLAHLIGR